MVGKHFEVIRAPVAELEDTGIGGIRR
jgi:hypothetical protein